MESGDPLIMSGNSNEVKPMRTNVLLAIAGVIALAAPAAQAQTPMEDHRKAVEVWKVTVRDHIAATSDWEKYTGQKVPDDRIRAACAAIGRQLSEASYLTNITSLGLALTVDGRYGMLHWAAAQAGADVAANGKVVRRCKAARASR